MPDYQAMYLELFRSTSKAIELLQTAQQKAEQLYLDAPEPQIFELDPDKEPPKP